ncbi:phage holin family protein [Ectopseudomonas khazarica]|uniref:phage holin family protein n=1 Tax=Ectopseudomonas khazarica TaxID=2502979 RepID=UPI003B939799
MVETLITAMTVLACLAILLRLMVFRRDGARYRPGIAVVAWLLSVCVGGYALAILFGLDRPSPFVLGILLILAALIFRARGNVASVLRVHWVLGWNGIERRRTTR